MLARLLLFGSKGKFLQLSFKKKKKTKKSKNKHLRNVSTKCNSIIQQRNPLVWTKVI